MNTLNDKEMHHREVPPATSQANDALPNKEIHTSEPRRRDAVRHWFVENTFAPRFLRGPLAHPAIGYVVAVLLQIVAGVGIMLLAQVFPTFRFSGALALLIVIVVALGWGTGPSIVATIVGALLLMFLVLPPHFSLAVIRLEDVIGLLLYLGVGLAISIVVSQVQQARAEAERLVVLLKAEREAFQRSEQEAAVRVSELETIFEAITDGIVVCDSKGQIQHTNPEFRRLFSLEKAAGTQLSLLEERGQWLALRDLEGMVLPQEHWPLLRVLRGERLSGTGAMDLLSSTREGKDIFVNVSGAPIIETSGQITGGVAVFRDVTERRYLERRTHKALEALIAIAQVIVQGHKDIPGEQIRPSAHMIARQLAELTRTVLGCQRLGITTIEPEREILHPLAIIGLSPEQERQWQAEQERQERCLSESFDPSLVEHLRANEVVLLDMMHSPWRSLPNPYRGLTVLIAPMGIGDHLVGLLSLDYGGAEHAYTAEEMALTGAVANFTALVIEHERLMQEQTEAYSRELALHEANQRMNEFLSIASHELRTPLTSIKGNLQLAKRRATKCVQEVLAGADSLRGKLEEMQAMLDRADRQASVQNRLVSDLLDISRIQADKLELQLEECDLTSIVSEAVADRSSAAPMRTIALDVPEGETVPVIADADRIGQVVSNYLTNALKYSLEDRPVEVRLQVEEATACLSVHDEGPGLSPAEQEHIWERFYRVPGIEVLSGSGVGLGLGLHICRTIIEQHHGKVGIESTQGAGSTFWFTLPLAKELR